MKFPAISACENAARIYSKFPFGKPPDGFQHYDSGWVQDPPTGMVMPREKWDVLQTERIEFNRQRDRSVAAEKTTVIKALAAEAKAHQAELEGLVAELAGTDLDDSGRVCELTARISSKISSRDQVRRQLAGTRLDLAELETRVSA